MQYSNTNVMENMKMDYGNYEDSATQRRRKTKVQYGNTIQKQQCKGVVRMPEFDLRRQGEDTLHY